MATVTRLGTSYTGTQLGVSVTTVLVGPSPFTLNPTTNTQRAGLVAGEAIATGGMPCYIKTSDGKVYKAAATDGTANSDRVVGYSASGVRSGDPITLYDGLEWGYYASTYTALPGNPVYLSSTAGEIDDATHYSGQNPCGYLVSTDGRVFLHRTGV